MISGGSTGPNRADQLLLREYLRSPDMAEKLDANLHLREHFGSQGDWFSRLWGGLDATRKEFSEYYLRRVQVEYDEFAGVLVLKAQAYEAEQAQHIAQALVQEGEAFMNRTAHAIAQDQVNFLEGQVSKLYDQVQKSRRTMLEFQEKKGLISPEAAAQVLAAIVADLQGQLADLQPQRSAMQASLVADRPGVRFG